MSGDMFWLALSVGLCLVIWIPYTLPYLGLVGIRAGTTDLPPTQQLPDWAKRCHRAHMNLIEVLVPFAILILMLQILDKSNDTTATAAAVFFFARIAHFIFYASGTPYLRTPAFAVSWLVCLYLLWQVFGEVAPV